MHDQTRKNKRRGVALIAGFVALVALVGSGISLSLGAGSVGLAAALVVGVGLAFAGYWKGDAIVLRASRAHPADPRAHARLYNLVEGLCISSGLPEPRLCVIDDPAPNAFVTGRSPRHGALAVTTGLLEKMSRVELEAVLAHELSHLKSHDTFVSTLVASLVGSVVLPARMGRGASLRDERREAPRAVLGALALALAPVAAGAMRAVLVPRRELLADAAAVSWTRYPPALVGALEKLRADPAVLRSASAATAHLWFESPAAQLRRAGAAGWLERLFDIHPALEERVVALREL